MSKRIALKEVVPDERQARNISMSERQARAVYD